MFKHSEQINELAAALSKAQGQMESAKKTSDNPYYKSKYADLAECWATCRKALSDNGLSVVQGSGEIIESTHFEQKLNADRKPVLDENGNPMMTSVTEMKLEVSTMLLHSSGQWMETTGYYLVGKQDIQGIGSAITYARRYALAAIIGLSQDDDDGNSNVEPPTGYIPKKKTKEPCVTFEDGVAIINAKGRSMPVPMMNEGQLRWVLTQPWAKAAYQSVNGILQAMELGAESAKAIDEALDK